MTPQHNEERYRMISIAAPPNTTPTKGMRMSEEEGNAAHPRPGLCKVRRRRKSRGVVLVTSLYPSLVLGHPNKTRVGYHSSHLALYHSDKFPARPQSSTDSRLQTPEEREEPSTISMSAALSHHSADGPTPVCEA